MIFHSSTKTPAYHITINDTDITDRFQGRLISLTLSDAAGFEADQLNITIDDHDNAVELPETGAVIGLKLGFKGEALVDKGTYTLDEIEHSGPPDVINLRARSADMHSGLMEQKTKAWHQETVGDIVTAIAKTHGLIPAISDNFGSVTIQHIDQTDESDTHFLTRLAQDYDAMATVKNGNLLFIRRSAGKTASGTPLPTVTIQRKNVDTHRYNKADSKYTGVRANWQTTNEAETFKVLVGKEGTVKTLRKAYPTEQEAWQAANAEWQRIAQGVAGMEIMLATANLELIPELPVSLEGWKKQIVEQLWHIAGPVTHQLDDALTTSIKLAIVNEE